MVEPVNRNPVSTRSARHFVCLEIHGFRKLWNHYFLMGQTNIDSSYEYVLYIVFPFLLVYNIHFFIMEGRRVEAIVNS